MLALKSGRSAVRTPGTAGDFVAERANQLERGTGIRRESRLRGDPVLGVVARLIDAAAVPGSALDDASVDEKQKHGDAARQ
jgi:hypothetical protein